MVGGARPVIRTSHEARRRASLAVNPSFTAEQLQNLSLLTEDHARSSGGYAEGRRASYDGRSPPSPLPSPHRRGSYNPPFPPGTPLLNIPGSGSSHGLNLSPGHSPTVRRKSMFKDGKPPPLRRFDTFNMEIKKSRIVFTVLVAAGGCVLVALVSYAIKQYL